MFPVIDGRTEETDVDYAVRCNMTDAKGPDVPNDKAPLHLLSSCPMETCF